MAERCVRTLMVRNALTAEATILQEYLPPGMAARLDRVPAELLPPKHPSQVAFEALQAAAGRTGVPVRHGLGRRARAARARLGAGGGMADGAAVALRGRAAERLATRAETAAQAPWRAAIAAARALRQATGDARRQTRGASNDPIRGMAGQQNPAGRNDPIRGTGSQTRDVRNDPIRGSAAAVWAAGVPLGARVGVLAERRAGETTEWAPGSRGLWEALAREVEKRRLRMAVGLRGNDPIRGMAVGAAGEARVALGLTSLGSTRDVAIGSTTLARTWEPGVAEVLAARFGPVMEEDWRGPPVAPLGIAAVPSPGCAQRPYMRLQTLRAGWLAKPGEVVMRR